jgi:tetratricopeptide (TPR) repeat protein
MRLPEQCRIDGIAVLFLRRRGVPVSRVVKRLLYGCFVLPYVLVFMAIHNPVASANRTPGVYEGTAFRVINLGIPAWVQTNLGALVEIAYLACLAGAVWGLTRRARWRDLGPAGAVVLTQALWFALPTVAMQWGWFRGVEPLHIEFQQYALMWVAVGHFLQYLWITTYYAASAESRAGRLRYLGKAMLAGNAIWVFPTLVFAPDILGRLPFDLGLGLLTASVVNIHHFILDGAIWKLRDGTIARVLLRDSSDLGAPSSAPAGRNPRPWIYGSLMALGALCTAVALGVFADDSIARRARATGDFEGLRRVQERRAWIGRDSPRTRLILAQQALRAGDPGGARENVERSLALHPTPEAYVARARLRGRAGDRRGEMEAYQAALEIDPDHVEALRRSGLMWLSNGRVNLARGALRRALSLEPDNPDLQDAWGKVQEARDPPL